MSLHSEMMSVTFKAKTQKCKPLLGPGVKTAWCKLQNSNKMLTLTQFQAGLDTRKPITHLHVQWQHTNIRTMFQKKNSDAIVLKLSKQMPVLTKHRPEHNGRPNKNSGNPSVIYSFKDATTIWLKLDHFLTWLKIATISDCWLSIVKQFLDCQKHEEICPQKIAKFP